MRTIFAFLAFLAIPAFAECGNKAVLSTVEEIIRKNYFDNEDEPRPLEILNVTFAARDDDLGNYKCSASVRFEATGADVYWRPAIENYGVYKIPFRFSVSQSATDPSEKVIGVTPIRALQKESIWDQ